MSRLRFLDGMRGIAAMWVLVFHMAAGGHLPNLKAALPVTAFEWIFVNGHLGVVVFFVLSGFVMSANIGIGSMDRRHAAEFLSRRLVRLTPPYYVALMFALCIAWLRWRFGSGQPPDLSAGNLLAHAAYLQELLGYAQIDPVFWTLCIEIQFYIAIVLMMAAGDVFTRWGWSADAGRRTAVGLGVLIGCAFLAQDADDHLFHGGFVKYWYIFMTGVLLERAGRAGAAMHDRLLLLFGTAALFPFLTGVHRLSVLATLVTALLILGFRRYEKLGAWLCTRPLQFLGLVSYSMYLIHNPFSMLSIPLLKRVGQGGGVDTDAVVLVGGAAACALASWVMYRLVELPAIEWSRSIRWRRTDPRLAEA